MKIAEAFNIVKTLCDGARLTKQERSASDEALQTILNVIKSKEEKKEEPKE